MAKKDLGRDEYLSGDRKPPTDELRLAMFLDLAADYVNLVKTMPMKSTLTWGGKPLPDSERWVIVLHATLLRKFFTDQVDVGTVVRAAQTLLRDDADPDLLNALSEVEKLASAHDAPTGIQLQVGALPISPWEAAQVQLHGRHVHSDYAKWRASNGGHSGESQYLQMWAGGAAAVVRSLIVNLRYAWTKGQFNPEVDLASWFDWSRWGIAAPDAPDVEDEVARRDRYGG